MHQNPMSKPNDDHEVALTQEHWDDLKDRWAELISDNMDQKTLERFVYETVREGFNDLTPTETINQFTDDFDRETVDDVIRDVTSPKSQRIGRLVLIP